MAGTRIWRMYPNGYVTEQTHVLGPHRADGQQCSGYDGDVDAWSEHNQKGRWGCTQIVQEENKPPKVIFQGNVDAALTDKFVEERT